MKISEIRLYNFGSYSGLNSFDLSGQAPEKRVVIIGGKNGAGKTTLFTAIQVGLYGNFAFGFKTAGRHYLKQIELYINNEVHLDEDGKSYVEIHFSHIVNGDLQDYLLHREWNWHDGKLAEGFKVFQNDKVLEEDELYNFQNYLIHLIPPDLLKLYFFDGEKIADYFLGDQTINIQEALMTLSGNDTFEIIYDNIKRFLSRSNSSSDVAQSYLYAKNDLAEVQNQVRKTKDQLESKINEAESIKSDILQMENEYAQKGGISISDWSSLQIKLKEEEEKRERLNWQRKSLATDVLPFFILHEYVAQIEPQIRQEKEFLADYALQQKLCSDAFSHAISEALEDTSIKKDSDIAKRLTDSIKRFFLNDEWENFSILFGLSSDEERQVLSVIERINSTSRDSIEKYKKRINASVARSKQIRFTIQSSSIEDFETFTEQRLVKEQELSKVSALIELLSSQLDHLTNDAEKKQQNFITQKKRFEESLKQKSITSIAGRLALLLEELEEYLYKQLISEVEKDLKLKFHQLIRKKGFFDDISIDRNWNVHIIRNENIAISDIANILESNGYMALEQKLGSAAVAALQKKLGLNADQITPLSLKKADVSSYMLPVEINKEQLSSGEKQIFVMALYWSLMQQSKNDLPFIIDTPFARIDTEHRKNITDEFFLKLNGQLFILSTNEEISGEHLSSMRDQIAHVYTLDYGSDRKTHIYADQYFEV